MQTWKRICLRDYSVTAEGVAASVVRGKEYITSAVNNAPSIGPQPKEGCVTVFSNYWFSVPVDVFGGEVRFT